MDHIKIFSPATVANVSCGYDVLGFCLDSVGDEMIINNALPIGISTQSVEDIREMSTRLCLQYDILSDQQLLFTNTLKLHSESIHNLLTVPRFKCQNTKSGFVLNCISH